MDRNELCKPANPYLPKTGHYRLWHSQAWQVEQCRRCQTRTYRLLGEVAGCPICHGIVEHEKDGVPGMRSTRVVVCRHCRGLYAALKGPGLGLTLHLIQRSACLDAYVAAGRILRYSRALTLIVPDTLAVRRYADGWACTAVTPGGMLVMPCWGVTIEEAKAAADRLALARL